MPPTKEVTATPYFLEFIVAAMIENIYTQTTLYYLKKLEIVAISWYLKFSNFLEYVCSCV